MSTRAQTELYTKEMKDILKNLKKREADRRHRLNKKRTFDEAITENEKLKREILDLKREKQWFEKRFKTIYNELEKEIECVRAEAEGLGEQGA